MSDTAAAILHWNPNSHVANRELTSSIYAPVIFPRRHCRRTFSQIPHETLYYSIHRGRKHLMKSKTLPKMPVSESRIHSIWLLIILNCKVIKIKHFARPVPGVGTSFHWCEIVQGWRASEGSWNGPSPILGDIYNSIKDRAASRGICTAAAICKIIPPAETFSERGLKGNYQNEWK